MPSNVSLFRRMNRAEDRMLRHAMPATVKNFTIRCKNCHNRIVQTISTNADPEVILVKAQLDGVLADGVVAAEVVDNRTGDRTTLAA